MNVKHIMTLLDEVYEECYNARTDKDPKLNWDLDGIQDKIEELQNTIEDLKL